MDKKDMQTQDLGQVSGGFILNETSICRNCHRQDKNTSDSPYPNGFFVKRKSSGCHSTIYYKRPGCGYEWTA